MYVMSAVLLDFNTDIKLFTNVKRKWADNQTELTFELFSEKIIC